MKTQKEDSEEKFLNEVARHERLNSDKCEICDDRKATVTLETGMDICRKCFNREFK